MIKFKDKINSINIKCNIYIINLIKVKDYGKLVKEIINNKLEY
jgi:hypothetical protein